MKCCPKCKYPNPDTPRECFKCGADLTLADEQDDGSTQTRDNAADGQQLQVCPFCRSDVSGQACKCRHCGEWLVGGLARLKHALPYYLAIILLLALITAAIVASRDRSQSSQSPTVFQPVAEEPMRLTVSEIRNDVLRYNNKNAAIRVTVVDMTTDQTRWVIADHWDAYWRAIASKYGTAGDGASGEQFIYMSPKVPTLKVGDVADVIGVYDADTNCLSVTSANVVKKSGSK